MLNEGFWPKFLELIDEQWQIWKNAFQPYPKKRVAISDPVAARTLSFAGLDNVVLTINPSNRFRCVHGTTGRTYPNRDAPAGTNSPLLKNNTYTFDYATVVNGEPWLASKAGTFAHGQNFAAA